MSRALEQLASRRLITPAEFAAGLELRRLLEASPAGEILDVLDVCCRDRMPTTRGEIAGLRRALQLVRSAREAV